MSGEVDGRKRDGWGGVFWVQATDGGGVKMMREKFK